MQRTDARCSGDAMRTRLPDVMHAAGRPHTNFHKHAHFGNTRLANANWQSETPATERPRRDKEAVLVLGWDGLGDLHDLEPAALALAQQAAQL